MDEAEEDWAAELTRDEGRPALATAISSVILLLSTCGRPDRVIASGTDTAAYLFGGTVAAIAIFWGIPYWITIRKSSRGWRIGSFVGIAVLAILTNLWALGSYNQRIEAGVRDQTRQAQEIAEGKRTRLEAGADADALQKLAAELGNRDIADLQSYHSELIAGGAERIAMLRGLQQDSTDLRNCERFEGFAARARSNRGKLDSYLTEARQKLDQEVSNGAVPREAADGFLRGAADSRPTFERTWELQAQYADAVGALCQILARRKWRPQHGQVAFTNDVDLAAANAQLNKIQVIAAEQQRMKSVTLGHMRQNSAASH